MEEQQPPRKKTKWPKAKFAIGFLFGVVIGLALFFALYFGLPPRTTEVTPSPPTTTVSPSVGPPNANTFTSYAVASDGGPCSVIGSDIIASGGSVVDSAIATFLCIGMYNSHSTGIGGGSFMTIYNATTGKAIFLNAREVAPLAANTTIFDGDGQLSQTGGLSIAVPGEIAGYWVAHQRYGVLPWSDLFQPSIKMAEDGFPLGSALAGACSSSSEYVHDRDYNLWPVFENSDGSLKQEGDIIRLPQLAATYRRIAEGGMEEFYRGSLSKDILEDIKDVGGIITAEDLDIYMPEWEEPLEVSLDDLTVYSPGPPASGAVLSLILNILDEYNLTSSALNKENKITTYQRIVEAFRFAYAKRSALGDDRKNATITELAMNMTSEWMAQEMRARIDDDQTHEVEYYDPAFQLNKESGTSHLSILGPNGDAVSMTSTVNLYWGSKVRGLRTGIIFNDEMDDFSAPNITNAFGLPPSPSNFIKPGNSPQSSMCPAIAVDGEGKVRIIAGASGGTKITSRTALTILNSLWLGMDIEESIETKQLHDQLVPNYIQFEEGFDQNVIDGLVDIGHDHRMMSSAGSIAQGISVTADGVIKAACDTRKGGYPAGV